LLAQPFVPGRPAREPQDYGAWRGDLTGKTFPVGFSAP